LAQVLADELDVPMSSVAILQGDTERCPYGSGSFASRSMVVTGGALILAARRVRDKVLAIAAHLLEASPDDLVLRDGAIAARGMGNALFERIVYDGAGQPITTSFMDYLIPTAMDVPTMTIVHVDTPPAVSVSGFKGMAEGGTIGATAAVANAVADALASLGVEVRELPLSPDLIFRLIRSAASPH